jgi:hypothetical protein
MKPSMGELIVKYKGEDLSYLINLKVADHVQDQAVQDILKYFPHDVEIEFKELY